MPVQSFEFLVLSFELMAKSIVKVKSYDFALEVIKMLTSIVKKGKCEQ